MRTPWPCTASRGLTVANSLARLLRFRFFHRLARRTRLARRRARRTRNGGIVENAFCLLLRELLFLDAATDFLRVVDDVPGVVKGNLHFVFRPECRQAPLQHLRRARTRMRACARACASTCVRVGTAMTGGSPRQLPKRNQTYVPLDTHADVQQASGSPSMNAAAATKASLAIVGIATTTKCGGPCFKMGRESPSCRKQTKEPATGNE